MNPEAVFLVSETYSIVSPASAEVGDFEEIGIKFKEEEMSLEELVDYIERNGFAELSCSYISDYEGDSSINPTWISTVDPEIDFKTGNNTYYDLHIRCTKNEFYKICKTAGIKV